MGCRWCWLVVLFPAKAPEASGVRWHERHGGGEEEPNYDYMKDVMSEYRRQRTFSKRLNHRLREVFLEPQPPNGYR